MERWEDLGRQPVVQIAIGDLQGADSPRLRGENSDHVAFLANSEADLPPIVVHRQTMRVIDGSHRLLVARRHGRVSIAARFFDGSVADAFVLAVTLNATQGLPLSLADRKAAARRIVRSHADWSVRMVAATVGLSPRTVDDIRRRVLGEPQDGEVRIGRDGRTRPVDGAEGREVALRLLAERPELSLRAIAREAGISPETVRTLKKRRRAGPQALPKGADAAQSGSASSWPPTTRPDVPLPERTPGRTPGRTSDRSPGEWQGGPSRVTRMTAGGPVAAPPRLDPAVALQKLVTDPALRFSETGRELLRLMMVHTITPADWDRILLGIPAHGRDLVAALAREAAQAWARFASNVAELDDEKDETPRGTAHGR